ncbi:MAG: hypothetical protein KDD82_03050 [Planctomycetes bacterium]|nr:hypothetical protein [Planctomycetota bacterium]
MSFLEGIGKLGDADLNAAQVAAAVEAGAVSPALRPILDRVQRIRLSGDTVRFDFSSAFALNLGGRGYAHFDRQVSFQIDGRTLKRFRGFKLSQTAKGMKLAPRSIRFGSEGGVPIATVNMGIAGTHKISLAPQHAEAQGLTSRLRFG